MTYPVHTPYFDLYRPIDPAACPGTVVSVGKEGVDGSKYICFGEDGNVAVSPESTDHPIIYSLGSNNNFHFERSMADACPDCEIHTFDCFAQYIRKNPEMAQYDVQKFNRYFPAGDEARKRVHLHPKCIGEPPSDWPTDNPPYVLFREAMKSLGHRRVSLLKIDIEGAEYGVLAAMGLHAGLANHGDKEAILASLPTQISIELHIFSRSTEKKSQESLVLAKGLRAAGYHVISREDNMACTFCTEFTFFRED